MRKHQIHYSNYRHKCGKKNRNKACTTMKDYIVIHGSNIPFVAKGNKEADVWKPVGYAIANSPLLPLLSDDEEIYVYHDYQKAVIKVKKDKRKLNFKLVSNDIDLDYSHYEVKKLRKVDADINAHLFYDFVPNSMGKITFDVGAHFGRIGMRGRRALEDGDVLRKPFPPCLFWLKYYQKLNEGYTDETEALGDEDVTDAVNVLFTIDEPEEDEDIAEAELYEYLIDSSKAALEDFNLDWMATKVPYTATQIKSCWKDYDQLVELYQKGDSSVKAMDKANKIIVDLIKHVSPNFKRGTTVRSFLIKEAPKNNKNKNYYLDEIDKQINTWYIRINSMEAICARPEKASKSKGTSAKGMFGTAQVRRATDEEFEHIKELIAKECPNQVDELKKVWMLECPERKKKYEEALETAENKTEKELFHGSDTANMISLITCGGPTIDHAANGMFGRGLYFAPSYDKSRGYTTIRGSRWHNGTENIGYMLINKVHYGADYRPHTTGEMRDTVVEGGYDCCHARATDCGLARDEIITYDNVHSYTEAILQFAYIY